MKTVVFPVLLPPRPTKICCTVSAFALKELTAAEEAGSSALVKKVVN